MPIAIGVWRIQLQERSQLHMTNNGSTAHSVTFEVAGPWSNHMGLATEIVQTGNGFVVAQGRLVHSPSQTDVPFTFTDGAVRVTGPAGSIDRLIGTVAIVDALLAARGTGVALHHCDLHHSADQWRELNGQQDESRLLNLFVNFSGSSDENYSYGMHALGLRDVVVDDHLEPEYATILMKAFVYFVFLDEPTTTGHATFRTGPHDPVYQLLPIPCATFLPDDVRYNPFGMWQLRRT